MITIRRSTDAGLQEVERPADGCWIDVTGPGPDEAKQLARDLNIPLDFVTSPLDLDELPRIQKTDDALLILVRIPHLQSAAASIPYVTRPIGIVVTRGQILTICRDTHELLRDLAHEHQTDLSTAKPTRFVLHLLWGIANSYLHHLAEINRIVEQLEERLQQSLQNRELLELLRYQKSLVHFITALRANETMLERLQRSDFRELDRLDQDLLDDVFTETRQAIGMTEIASNILSQMMDAFATIISNNLNVIMKFLASAAVILIVPTIISGFYGMNVSLPLEDNPRAFLAVIGLSILGALAVGLIFKKKNWL